MVKQGVVWYRDLGHEIVETEELALLYRSF